MTNEPWFKDDFSLTQAPETLSCPKSAKTECPKSAKTEIWNKSRCMLLLYINCFLNWCPEKVVFWKDLIYKKEANQFRSSSPRKTYQWRIRGHRGLHGPKNVDLQGFAFAKTGPFPTVWLSFGSEKKDLIQSIMTRLWFQRFLLNLYPETHFDSQHVFRVKVELVHRGIICHGTKPTYKENPGTSIICFASGCFVEAN